MPEYVLIAGGIKDHGMGRFLKSNDFFSLAFDSTQEIGFNYSSKVTDHPVSGKNKTNISSNVSSNPKTFTLDCFVTNTPTTLRDGNFIEFDDELRWQTTLEMLSGLMEAGEFISLASPIGVVTDCVITGITGAVTVDSINGMSFNISIKQIKVVSAESIVLPASIASSIAASVQNSKSSGNKDKDGVGGETSKKKLTSACLQYQKYVSSTRAEQRKMEGLDGGDGSVSVLFSPVACTSSKVANHVKDGWKTEGVSQ